MKTMCTKSKNTVYSNCFLFSCLLSGGRDQETNASPTSLISVNYYYLFDAPVTVYSASFGSHASFIPSIPVTSSTPIVSPNSVTSTFDPPVPVISPIPVLLLLSS